MSAKNFCSTFAAEIKEDPALIKLKMENGKWRILHPLRSVASLHSARPPSKRDSSLR